MSEDLLGQIDEWGPEKVVCVSDRRTGIRLRGQPAVERVSVDVA